MAHKKNILIATTSRSDFASLERIVHLLKNDAQVTPILFVTGDHYAADAGKTVDFITKSGSSIDAMHRVRSSVASEQVAEVLTTTAKVIKKYDISYALVCGDRKETFAVASACALEGIPIFHIHGGDVTYGMIDDAMRHAITKLSAIHFPATALSARRIRQMGEESWRIHTSGSPDVDGLNSNLPEKETLEKMALTKKKYALMLLNPETLAEEREQGALASAVLSALMSAYADTVVLLPPNNDAGSSAIRKVYAAVKNLQYVYLPHGLSRPEYLALLKNAAFLIGNSSSGITEAATFKIPVVNVGGRQDARERSKNVVDVDAVPSHIKKAIRKVQNSTFKASLSKMHNVYGTGGASVKIYRSIQKIIRTYSEKKLLYKKFTLV